MGCRIWRGFLTTREHHERGQTDQDTQAREQNLMSPRLLLVVAPRLQILFRERIETCDRCCICGCPSTDQPDNRERIRIDGHPSVAAGGMTAVSDAGTRFRSCRSRPDV